MLSSHSVVAALICAELAFVSPLSAQEFSRLDALTLLNQDASNWILGASNPRLNIDFLRMPRVVGEQGKACGGIISNGQRLDPNAFRSYSATLWIEKGRLVVGNITPFFMSVDELLADDLCR